MADADRIARSLHDLVFAAEAVRSGAVTAAELVEGALARARSWEPRLHAFTWLDADRARRLASEADRARSDGAARGALHGIPIGVKDIYDTAGIPTENGSTIHRGRVPTQTAPSVAALEGAGAIVLGKTVTTEFAFYHPGPTRNPWNLSRTPGGSSSGSAAAVAAGIVPGALGSQTNGSVLRPAAFCGVVGFKPSHGRVPSTYVLAFAPTLDTMGTFARSVEGAAWLAALMAGDAPDDWAPLAGAATAGAPAPRLAVAVTSDLAQAEPAARARLDADIAALKAAGARVERPPLPSGVDDEAMRLQRAIMAREGYESFRDLVAGRESEASPQLRALIEEGAKMPRVAYETALRDRARLVRAFTEWAEPFDGCLTIPAVGEAPPPETTGDPRFCTRWTLLGAPAITLPTGLGPSGLPLGLQVIGAPGDDRRLLAAAGWIEQRLPAPAGPPQMRGA